MDNKPIHIILGAGGAIGTVLAEELLKNDEAVKLVSRTGHFMEGTETAIADLTNFETTLSAVDKSSIVYLMAGLPYDRKVWRKKWPLIMSNTIEACKAKGARLIFFDNVYMYGRVDGRMTEETPVDPDSAKGKIRAEIAGNLLNEMKSGNIKAMITRAADFYGPHAAKASLPYLFVFEKLAHGKKAQVLVNPQAKHSYTYTEDCGKALYMLAMDNEAYGEIWHLPTAGSPPTNEEFIEIAADLMQAEPKYSILRKWMVGLAGLFDKTVREVYEMLYQNQSDYVFDSTKFENRYSFKPTSYEKGIEETIVHFRRKRMI